MKEANWKIKSWNELSKNEFHDIIQLRESVFVEEQSCSYLDVDGKDKSSYHLFLYDNDSLIAYSRLIPKGISYTNTPSIGRVVVHPKHRGNQIGRQMMNKAISSILEIFVSQEITISAQSYLLEFYTSLGFKTTGEEYLEDNLPHVKMIYSK